MNKSQTPVPSEMPDLVVTEAWFSLPLQIHALCTLKGLLLLYKNDEILSKTITKLRNMADAPHSVFEAGSSDNSRQLLAFPLCKDRPLTECLKLQNKNTPRTISPTKQRIKGKSSWPFASYSAFNSAQKSQLHTVEIRCLWCITSFSVFILRRMLPVVPSPITIYKNGRRGAWRAPAISSWYLSHCYQNSDSAIPQVTSAHWLEFTNCSTSLKSTSHKQECHSVPPLPEVGHLSCGAG